MAQEPVDLVTQTNKSKPFKQLKLRVITGVILAIVVISTIYTTNPTDFAVFSGIVIFAAGYEMAHLSGLWGWWRITLYLLFLLGIFVSLPNIDQLFLVQISVFSWLILLPFLLIYPWLSELWTRYSLRIPLGLFWLAGGWLGLRLLFEGSNHRVMYLLLLVWAVDIGSYFAGNLVGRYKLIPQLSPGKTWEGLLGGLISGFVIACLGGIFFHIPLSLWASWLLMATAVMFISVVGDLSVSFLKRVQGVKDSGRLLPGHGGLLDRIDSLLPAAALLCVSWHWFGF